MPHAAFALGMGTTLVSTLVAAAQTPSPQRFTDPRDGYSYAIVTIGKARWFAENLRFRIWRSAVNVTYWLSVRCVGEPTRR